MNDDYACGYANGLKDKSESCDLAWSIVFFTLAVRIAGWVSEQAIATNHLALHAATIVAFAAAGLFGFYSFGMLIRFFSFRKG